MEGRPENAPGAVMALVLGIVGILLCPLSGPFAWAIGNDALKAARKEPRYAGEGLALAGKVLGIISTILLIIGIIYFIGSGPGG